MNPRHLAIPIAFTFLTTPLLLGQAAPATTAGSTGPGAYEGFTLPDTSGTVRYSLTASEAVVTGYSGEGAQAYTNLGGNIAYLSRSQKHPFSAIYSGGYLIGNSNFPSYSYQNLALSQAYYTRNWDFVVADSVSYLPETPASGLSGIPGDLSNQPVTVGSETGLGILTTYAKRVTNTVDGTVNRHLTGKTSISVTGEYDLQRYLDSNVAGAGGINNDEELGTLGLQHRVNDRTSFGALYSFANSTFDYAPLTGFGANGYQTHTVEATAFRQLNRKLSLTVSAGPQFLRSNGGLITSNSVNLAFNGGLDYRARLYDLRLTYVRGINNGGGVVIGANTDYATFTASRYFRRRYQVAGLVGYNDSKSLANSALGGYTSSGVLAGGQFSTVIHRDFSVFASYTLERQNFQGIAVGNNAYNGLSNYITVGVTFSPPAHFTKK